MMRERCYNRVERAECVENGANGEDFLTQRRKGAENAKSWPMVRLGDVCEVINGLWKGTKEPLINVGVIRATNFTKQCEFDVTKTVFIDVEEKKFLKRKLQFGDIIVERSGGGPNQPVGRVIYFDQKDGNYSLSNFTSALRVKNSIDLDPYFLYRVLVACYVTGVTEKMQSNSVQLRNIDFERYLNIQIPLPPLSVQREIVERLEKELGEADKVAAEFKRMAELADKEFKAELDETFNSLSANSASPREIKNDGVGGFVTRGAAEDAEKCPMVRLGDVAEIKYGYTAKKVVEKENDYPCYLRITDIQDGEVDWKSVPYCQCDDIEAYRLMEGDIVFARTGATTGKSFLLRGDFPLSVFASYLIRVRIEDWKDLYSIYLKYYFDTSEYWDKIKVGIAGAAQGGFNSKKLAEIQFPLPPI